MRAGWLVALFVCGCVSSRSIAVGPPEPPRPAGCAIDIAADPPEELLDDYQRVGSVCVGEASGPGIPESVRSAITHRSPVRDELFRSACALGGEVVALADSCSLGRFSGVEFAVLRARHAPAAGESR